MKHIFKSGTLLIFFALHSSYSFPQSFSEDKTSMINYIKRMYNTAPFEGAKMLEGAENKFYIAAITLSASDNSNDKMNSLAEIKAQEIAKKTFAEPCIKFEMLSTIINEKTTTFLFSCQPLSEFVEIAYKKQPFDGAKIIAAPKSSYFISIVSLDNAKYTSTSIMDRVALIKAKQQANTLFNGSVISSDIIIYTEETSGSAKTQTTEIIKEQSMGFVEGLETLLKFDDNGKKVYTFFRELTTK